jgi:hypothetical protein
MNDQKSPIDELFTDSEPLNISAIVDALKRFIRIKRETHEIFFTDEGNNISILKRILVFGLGKKLLKVEEYIDTESFSAKEVSERLQIKKGTVDGLFNSLRGKSYILGSGSDYTIPNYKITDILALLEEKNG